MNTIRKLSALGFLALCFFGVLGWSLYQQQASPRHPLSQLVPEGALLFIEAKDFGGLMHDWNNSPEKAAWVKSDNHGVFSNSRLFLRLSKASNEFAAAAGVPVSMGFLNQAAGEESAIAIYDIGQLEFLYITRLPSERFAQSPLWLSRNKFQPRKVAGLQFFARTNEESERVVAFAMAGDYLILATREDLVAGALQLLSGGKDHALAQEGWYTQAVAAAPAAAGDLRMVLNMDAVAVAPHFRTYWIQQNITRMQSYAAAISDLYREGTVYREERVLLPKKQSEDDAARKQSAEAVTALLTLVPPDYGFYEATSADAGAILATLEQKVLAPHLGAASASKLAPEVQLTSREIGTGSDLEMRIDVEPASRITSESSIAADLQKQLDAANSQALLLVQGTHKNKDGVLFNIGTVMVISAAGSWDVPAVQKAIQDVVAPGLTASRLGLRWREVTDAGGYSEWEGLYPVQMALRGKLLYVANNPGMLVTVLQTKAAAPAPQAVNYAAGFSHSHERQGFYDFSSLVDQTLPHAEGDSESDQPRNPKFFSDNVGSFSRAFARLDSEEMVTRETKDRIQQTVTYRWSQ